MDIPWNEFLYFPPFFLMYLNDDNQYKKKLNTFE